MNSLNNYYYKNNNIKRNISIYIGFSINDISNKFIIPIENILYILNKNKINYNSKNFNIIFDINTTKKILELLNFNVYIPKIVNIKSNILKDIEIKYKQSKKIIRHPIVTIMGHVDHGKTTLLDCIRKSNIALNESGGITQSIGSYIVNLNGLNGNQKITFFDTPGHEAFSLMRKRGIKFTDILILVVAADDSVKPQTREIISQAKLISLPIIVAINKVDRFYNNINKVIKDLANENIVPKKNGGNSLFVNVSAKTGFGINLLLNNIVNLSKKLNLYSPINAPGKGVIIDAKINKNLGIIVTILVLSGNFKKGDIVLAGYSYGKIKIMFYENKKELINAYPSMPVNIVGLNYLPKLGEDILVIDNKKIAKNISELYKKELKNKELEKKDNINKRNLLINFNNNNYNNNSINNNKINFIIKVDSQGSKETFLKILSSFMKKYKIFNFNILISDIGDILEKDINLAVISNSLIIGFNVRISIKEYNLAKRNNVIIFIDNIIYKLLDLLENHFKNLVLKLQKPKEIFIGYALIKRIFKVKEKTVLGCIVERGLIIKNGINRIIRNNKCIWSGYIDSIKNYDRDVEEVKSGLTCGIIIKDKINFLINDVIKSYKLEKSN